MTTEREYTETRVGCGKNLLKPQGNTTAGGVTYTLQDNGTYLANGTVTSTGLLALYKGVLPPGQYTISGGAGGIQVSLAVYKADGAYIRTICTSYNGASATGTVTELTGEEAYHQAFIQALSSTVGQAVTNVVLSPQLEAGNTATAFEPYEDVPFISIDNAQGQVQSVAVEAGCRTRQAGTGDPSPENIRAITGRESVEIAACGKNLFPSMTSAVTVRGLTVSLQADGTVVISGTATGQVTVYTFTGMLPDGQYTISGGADNASVALIAVDANNQWKRTIGGSWGNPGTFNFNGLLDGEYRVRMMIQTASNSAGQTFDNVVLSPQLEAGGTATTFEPYRSMGGGTVTPTEPLYGLPGAEDTVEASVDGDVLVTRRTAVLELDGTETNIVVVESSSNHARLRITPAKAAKPSETTRTLGKALCSHYKTVSTGAQWNDAAEGVGVETNGTILIFDARFTTLEAWKTYLAAQYAAGTPVTIVYELAAPETEALTAISPIAPQPGQLNLFTDADALTATIHGSGWETVNDTNDIRAALADVDSDVAGLIAGMGLLEGTVAQLGEQMITPEGVVSIVAASDGYQALVNMANQSADGLELVRVTVSNLNGRVETLEEGVHVEGSNVGLYSSGSPFRMDIDHTGIASPRTDSRPSPCARAAPTYRTSRHRR